MGVLISFSGIDGAGKSTQVKLLSEYLNGKGKKVKDTEEMFGYFLLKPLVRILRTTTGSPPEGPVKRNKINFVKLWFIPAYMDVWLGYIFKIRPILDKYDVLIADRFYTDLWANLLYYGYLPNWAFGIFVKLLPKADVALMFSVEPGKVLQRESEFPPAYYKEQAKIYKHLTEQVSFNIVDANKDKKVSFEQIVKYLQKYEDSD